MSVQLIVYPQNYDGSYNGISTSPTEFIVNGINFSGLGSTVAYTSNALNPFFDSLTNSPPSIVNTWYRFRNNPAPPPDYPSEVGGSLILESLLGLGCISGVYQRLSNLVIGQQYTITINLSVATTGFIVTQVAQGSSIYATGNNAATSTLITETFTAQSTDSTVMICYLNNVVDTATITSVSVQPVIGAIASGATNVLENGQVICDLYEDEDLPLTLSIDDFKNVAEKVQSYSKAFNLPSTKRNNKIFNAIFEITRSNDGIIFNPYKKTQCVLKQDGFILFEGFLRLLDVTDKEGEISYNVNLFSEVVALADTLQDRAFRDLDFTELEHDYNKTQITVSWNDFPNSGITYLNPSTSGFRDANSTVKYPFVDWTHQILIGGTSGTLSSATVGNPEFTSLEQMFRPFINIKYLIDRIFQATEFTYESVFFNTTDFKKLYMDFNWGEGNAPVVFNTSTVITTITSINLTTSYTTLDLAGSSPPPPFGYSGGIFTAQIDNQSYSISYNMIFKDTSGGGTTLDVEWVINGVAIDVVNVFVNPTPSFYHYAGFINVILSVGDTIFCRAKSTGATMYLEGGSNSLIANTTSSQTTSNTLLGTLRGELGQWDFLKGLITMFNLVTLVDEDNPNNIIIEPYTDVFIPTATAGNTLANRGIEHDWTDKIDVSQIKLKPLTDLNRKTIFKFVEDEDDYAFNQYKSQVGGHLYGSKKYNAGNEFNILEGEKEIIAEPFAATVVKPLMSQFPSFITPSLYSMGEDGVSEGFDNSPRIMFNNGIKSTGVSYYIPAQNGVTSNNETNFLQFSHLTDIPTITTIPPALTDTRDFHFGECQLLTGVGNATANNLFNTYWLPYYSEIYNPNTRTMTIKVNLSPSDINTFKMNDRVFIKNRVFRVNKIDYKPNDLATVEFILIP